MADGAKPNDVDPDVPMPTVTADAFDRLAEILAAEAAAGRTGRVLRVSVLGGGCSGFQYRFELADAPAEDDIILARDETKVVVDPMSAPLLAGAAIDYKREMIGARFAIENPNASSTCGCGTSFSI